MLKGFEKRGSKRQHDQIRYELWMDASERWKQCLRVDTIKATGYGLGGDVHRRIKASRQCVSGRVRLGNLCRKRAMSGAVVGVQPIGRERRSELGRNPVVHIPYSCSPTSVLAM
jgi:hypothetical protein